MNIDSDTMRRLRDHLLEHVEPTPNQNTLAEDAVVRRLMPFAETMYLVMMADGHPAAAERQAFTAALGVLSDGGIAPSQVDAMLSVFEQRLQQDGVEFCLERIGAHLAGNRDDRETAFSLGAVTALADDRVDWRENRVLKYAQEYFGISNRRVDAILDSVG